VDGLIAATQCRLGSRTLRILDFGKVAVTFTDVHTEISFRIVPQRDIRSNACEYVPTAKNKWDAMLKGYQTMPTSELLTAQQVHLNMPISQITSRPGVKAVCESCDEEIINGREVFDGDAVLCRACAGESYYHFHAQAIRLESNPANVNVLQKTD